MILADVRKMRGSSGCQCMIMRVWNVESSCDISSQVKIEGRLRILIWQLPRVWVL